MLPSLSALDKYSSDHLMSSLGFSHYTTIGVRKLPEGNHLSGSSSHPTSLSPIPNYSSMVTSPSPVTTILAPVTTHATYSTTMAPSSSSTTSAYSYFAAPSSVDLSSPLYGSYTTTGVFSSKTLQPSRPRSKARANAGKIPSRYFSGLVAPLTPVHGFESRHDLSTRITNRFGLHLSIHATHFLGTNNSRLVLVLCKSPIGRIPRVQATPIRMLLRPHLD